MADISIPPVYVDKTASLRTTMYGAEGEPDIRRFNAKAINDAISENMAILKDDEKVAAIAYADKEGMRMAIVGRVKSIAGKKIPGKLQWTVMNDVSWKGEFTPSAALRWSI